MAHAKNEEFAHTRIAVVMRLKSSEDFVLWMRYNWGSQDVRATKATIIIYV